MSDDASMAGTQPVGQAAPSLLPNLNILLPSPLTTTSTSISKNKRPLFESSDDNTPILDISISPSPSVASTTTTTMAGVGPARADQPPGDELQAIPKKRLVESGADYREALTELQIREERWDEVVTGILQVIRGKKVKNLKTATAVMIRDLSAAFIRGYGNILYKRDAGKWLVDEKKLREQGKERIKFTARDIREDGANSRLFEILEGMWWVMRGVVFERKGALARGVRGMRKERVDGDTEMDGEQGDLPLKESGVVARPRGRPPKQIQAPAQTVKEPKMRFEQKQEKALERIEEAIDQSKQNGNLGQGNKYQMTALETDEAVQDLIARLHEIRSKSDVQAFERAWDANIARLDEIEGIEELRVKRPAQKRKEEGVGAGELIVNPREKEGEAPFKKMKLSAAAPTRQEVFSGLIPSEPAMLSGVAGTGSIAPGKQDTARTLSVSNLANEPFNTSGTPSILNALRLGQTPLIPTAISVYISSHPSLSPSAYHWPSAPIGIADCKRLFDGIDQRVEIINISGYTLSYGWDDVMRAVRATDQGKRDGFDLLRGDVERAARLGVTRWRLKVLVMGVARVYQGKMWGMASRKSVERLERIEQGSGRMAT